MSRVEPEQEREQQQKREADKRQPADRTPGKAEGEVRDVEEALERREESAS